MSAKFVVVETYEQRAYSNYDYILRYTVISRSDRTLVLSGDHNGRLKIRRLGDANGDEWVSFPGSISSGSIWASRPKVPQP